MVGAVFNRACMYCARGVLFLPARFFLLAGPGPVSVVQDRLILTSLCSAGSPDPARWRSGDRQLQGGGICPSPDVLRGGFPAARFFCCLKQDGQDEQDVQDETQQHGEKVWKTFMSIASAGTRGQGPRGP